LKTQKEVVDEFSVTQDGSKQSKAVGSGDSSSSRKPSGPENPKVFIVSPALSKKFAQHGHSRPLSTAVVPAMMCVSLVTQANSSAKKAKEGS
jgi:hypothetical protein